MGKEMTKAEAMRQIEEFFSRRDFSSEEMIKIKRLSMKFRIRLGDRRRNFCKKCLSKLSGKTRITKSYKTVECKNCGCINRSKIDYSE
jgi:RNase P subunit RPR2